MILGRKSTTRPTPSQEQALGRHAGARRATWNWGLRRKIEAYKLRKESIAAGTDPKSAPKVPTAIDLHKEINKLKKLPVEQGGFPWMYESSKCAPQEALRDLDKAFENFFRRVRAGHKPGFPKFKTRGRDPGRFKLTGVIRVKDGRITLPRIGSVKIMPGDKNYIPDGTYEEVSVREEHGRWTVSVKQEVKESPLDLSRPVVGIDVGVRELMHLSDGTVIPNPKALAQEQKRLRKASLSVARKQRAADKKHGVRKKGGRRVESNRLKQARKVEARLARRVACIREDGLQKATTWVAKTYGIARVESLQGKNMTRARKGRGRAAKAGLNRAILDSGMLRARFLLDYKMPLHGGLLEVVVAAYTTMDCHECGARNRVGSSKIYRCAECGIVRDRDENASLVIRDKPAASSSAVSPGVSKPKVGSRGVAVSPSPSPLKAKRGRQAAVIRQSGGKGG